ncbi:MAG TPA: AarF/UbiB family protein [Acidimicrobiia bacterium]
MGDLVLSVGILLLFAWVTRGLLGARELTWRRTLLAVIAGIIFGQAVAVLLVLREIDVVPDVDGGQVLALSLPFALVGTMGAMVVIELLFSRKPTRSRRRLIHPIRALRRRVGIMLRGWEVTRIAVRNGLAPLLGLRRGEVSTRSPGELARRVRTALEEAGGVFIKLGQLLATRPDLLPPEALAELSRLHASAAPLPREAVERVLREEMDRPPDQVFATIDWEPLGSGSIAQAHGATLVDGGDVVVKLRRPGLPEQVERDLAIARWLARNAERRTKWGRQFQVTGLVEEFADALHGELDFHIEARMAAEAAAAVATHPRIRSVEIVESLTTERLLVMRRLRGAPLSDLAARPDPDRARLMADALCLSQIGAMLEGGRFHGDPHPGNVLVMEDDTLGLIDFGITGKLDSFERASVFQMLVAIKLEQPSLLYEAMVSIGAVSPTRDPEEIERALAQFLSTHMGSGLPSPDALTELLALTNKLQMQLPRSTATMFRALATLAGTLEQISPGYPLIDVVADIGGAELRDRMLPGSVGDLVQQEWAQLGPLLSRAPRHVDRIATLLTHGRLTTRLRLFTHPDDVRVVERLLNRALVAVLSIGVGLVSVLLLGTAGGPELVLIGVRLYEVLAWIGLSMAIVLLMRVLLAVARADDESPG